MPQVPRIGQHGGNALVWGASGETEAQEGEAMKECWRRGHVMTSCGVSGKQKARYKKELEHIVGHDLEFRDVDPVAHSRREKNDIIKARNVLAERMQRPLDVPQFHDLDSFTGDA